MRKAIVGITLVVLVGGGAVALYSHAKAKDDKGFKTVAVTRGTVVEKALAVGSIRPEREVAVKSKISGIVKRSYHEVGDRVKAGDPLFEILPDPTPLELTEARREAEIARNIYEQAKKRYERSESLRKQGIVSSQDADTADKEIRDAEIRLRLAAEKLALVEKGRVRTEQLNVESIIRAPISGTVLELLVNEGDPVVPLTSYQAGTALTTLGIVIAVLAFGLPGVVLRAGYSANADIVVREKQAVLLLPERLVTFKEGKASVEVPAPGKPLEPQRKEIKTGLSDGLNVEVAEGLREQDLVVERPPKKIE